MAPVLIDSGANGLCIAFGRGDGQAPCALLNGVDGQATTARGGVQEDLALACVLCVSHVSVSCGERWRDK